MTPQESATELIRQLVEGTDHALFFSYANEDGSGFYEFSSVRSSNADLLDIFTAWIVTLSKGTSIPVNELLGKILARIEFYEREKPDYMDFSNGGTQTFGKDLREQDHQ